MPSAEAVPLMKSHESSASKVLKAGAMTNEIVLGSEIPWPSFQTAGIITKEQLEMIYSIDKQPVSVQVGQFRAKGAALVACFIDLLVGINKEQYVCYVLAMLDEITSSDSYIAGLFVGLLVDSNGAIDSVAPFLKLLQRSSSYLVEKAATMVGRILASPPSSNATDAVVAALNHHLTTFAKWTVDSLKEVSPAEAAESSKVIAAMGGLQSLCSTMTGRAAAIDADALSTLTTLVTASAMSNSSSTVQLLYQTLFSLWSLSYSPEAALEMASSKVGLIAKLVDIVRTSAKEKVQRVALSTLRNLLGVGSASNDMVVCGLMGVLEGMQARKFADEDIPEDVDHMHAALQVNLQTLSSWDVYKAELESGKLEWSPSHKSDNFWKDNHKAFEGSNCAAVKQLVGYLASEDPQVLAVACNDIAEFIKHHPEGRRLMTQYGAKPLAMQILKHPDPNVQKHALTCVQRLMVINWEYLNRG